MKVASLQGEDSAEDGRRGGNTGAGGQRIGGVSLCWSSRTVDCGAHGMHGMTVRSSGHSSTPMLLNAVKLLANCPAHMHVTGMHRHLACRSQFAGRVQQSIIQAMWCVRSAQHSRVTHRPLSKLVGGTPKKYCRAPLSYFISFSWLITPLIRLRYTSTPSGSSPSLASAASSPYR